MRCNSNYGNIIDNQIHFAPYPLIIGGLDVYTNDDDIYIAHGYKRIILNTAPSPTENHTVALSWDEGETTITQVWEQVPIPDVLSEEDYIAALNELGVDMTEGSDTGDS